MTIQSDIQKELREEGKQILRIFIGTGLFSGSADTDIFIDEKWEQLFDLFKRMAQECVPHKKEKHHPMFDAQKFEVDGFNACAVETHKNIEEKFR